MQSLRVWPPPKLLPSVARRLALAVTSLALIAHIVLLIHLGDAERSWLERAWAGGFGVWILGPFLAPLALLVATERISGAWITAGVLLVSALSIWAYGAAFFGERIDAQAALVFLFAPLYQYALMMVAVAVAVWRGATSATSRTH